MGKQWSSERLYFWGSKIIAYSDCSHEIKRNLLLGRKIMTNLDSLSQLISNASRVMLKILQARLQQYVNHELRDVQAGFRKGRGTRDQIANIRWIMEKATEFQKNIYFCFIDYAKAFDCVDHNKQWKILKEMGKPVHLTCLLRNLYAGQEAKVRTGHGTTDWFQIGKEYVRLYIVTLLI